MTNSQFESPNHQFGDHSTVGRSVDRSIDKLTPSVILILMPRHTATATTRLPGPSGPRDRRQLLDPGSEIESLETRLSYRVEQFLGQGGFGQVYLARRLGSSSKVPASVCIKVSTRIDGWLREAYFGQLLGDDPRAIRIFDAFPSVTAGGGILYCLALEYARHGDLSAFIQRTNKKWAELVVRREIAGILQVLVKLHRGQHLHRDLTPMNVFVCDAEPGNRHPATVRLRSRTVRASAGQGLCLKLGDFGIVRHQGSRKGVIARTLNPLMAPSDIFAGAAPKWQARDDVYQVGQLLAMLVKGDARARVRTSEIRTLPCSDQLKEICHRCIGERRKRYESADELIEAIQKPPSLPRSGFLRSLTGVHLAFTGIFKTTRPEVARAARRAGAIVHSGPSRVTTVLVRGRPNKLQAAGRDAGLKLMEIKRLRERGHKIALINEARFWQLCEKRSANRE
jgi:serine/threonine-protein kinase